MPSNTYNPTSTGRVMPSPSILRYPNTVSNSATSSAGNSSSRPDMPTADRIPPVPIQHNRDPRYPSSRPSINHQYYPPYDSQSATVRNNSSPNGPQRQRPCIDNQSLLDYFVPHAGASKFPSTGRHRRHFCGNGQSVLNALVPVAGESGGVAADSFMWKTAHMRARHPKLGRVRRGHTEDAFWRDYRDTIQRMDIVNDNKKSAVDYGMSHGNEW